MQEIKNVKRRIENALQLKEKYLEYCSFLNNVKMVIPFIIQLLGSK